MCGAKPPPHCTGTERFTYKSRRNSLYCLISSLTWVLLWPQDTVIYCLSHKCRRRCVMPPGWTNPDVFRWVHIMDWPSALLASSCGWGWLWERARHQVSPCSITSCSFSQRMSGFLPLCFNNQHEGGVGDVTSILENLPHLQGMVQPLGSCHRLENGHPLICGSSLTEKHECPKCLSSPSAYRPFPISSSSPAIPVKVFFFGAELRLAKPLLTSCFFFL